jgi:putative membrane protein
MKYLLAAAMAVIAFAGLSSPSSARTSMRGMSTEAFVRQAAAANQFIIASSQLALQKAQNDQIKQFAQKMIDDHTKIGEQIKQTLQQANLQAPPPELAPEQQAFLSRLKNQNGPAFDRNYVMAERLAHMKVARLLTTYLRSGNNPAVKQVVKETLPVIKEHLRIAEALPGGRPLTAKR